MKKHIPNTITCCNLISGCIATYFAFMGDAQMALLFIVIGAVFDFFDGMVARLLHVSSPIGKELDSLADDITFGFAPSAIVFNYLCTFHIHLLFVPFLAFVMAAFSALRLAKFNLDERQALGFIGLPTAFLGLAYRRFGKLECVSRLSTLDPRRSTSLPHPSRHLHQLLPAHCRNTHVRPEVQDLGLEGE